jgi:hypothetical protein
MLGAGYIGCFELTKILLSVSFSATSFNVFVFE